MNKSYEYLSKNTALFFRSLIVFLLLFSSSIFGQNANTVTAIYTDYNGYWTSSSALVSAIQPNDYNNLLAFSWKGNTYSTGVDNATLSVKSVSFKNTRFRALKIQSLPYSGSSYLQGSMIDGSLTNRVLTPAITGSQSTPAELASRLTDGINGLALGTGIANIAAGTSSEFKVGVNNLQLGVMGDGVPDILVTQVAATSSLEDTFKFVDSAGNIVGNAVSVNFGAVSVVGRYRLDLFNSDDGLPSYTENEAREIRLLAMDVSSFGIDDSNSARVDRFVVTFSGGSDCAFIAFNSNSLKISELSLVKKATIAGCGKIGDVINYTFDIKNTGEALMTNINLTDELPGVVLSGGSIASLGVGETVTLTGTYTITAADVAAGRVVNSAKVTGTGPSGDIVEDFSGQTYTDDIATVVNLSTLPVPVVGAITNANCTANNSGSVVLSNLPATGTWTLVRSPGAVQTSGSGTSTTVTGLAQGTYTFKVTSDVGCVSLPTSNVVIGSSSNTWNGSWSKGTPDSTQNLVFTKNYSSSSDLSGCSCTVNAGAQVIINSGNTLTITNKVTVNPAAGSALIFEDGASLLQINNVTNSGNIIYKRATTSIIPSDYTYWSSPVLGQKLAISSSYASGLFYSYDDFASTEDWKQETAATTMVAGKGYIIRGPQLAIPPPPGFYVATFTGIPNNGVITRSIGPVGTSNLIGNPYPSAIDAIAFLDYNASAIEGTIYFWTHKTAIQEASNIPVSERGTGTYAYTSNDYVAYNVVGGVGAWEGSTSSIFRIAAGQSFFSTSLGSGNVTFNNSMRVAGNNAQFFKTKNSKAKTANTVEKHRIWLNLTNAKGAFKQTLLGYVSGATNDNETRFDGESFDGNEFVDFYSVNQDKNLVIQGRALPFDENDEVPLGYRSAIDGAFNINIEKVDGLLANQDVIIEDKLTNTEFDLKNGNYTFNTEAGTFNDRFVLKYKATSKTLGTGDFSAQTNKVLVAVKNKQIKINSSAETIKNVVIYDVLGRQIYQKDNVNSNELSITNLVSSNQVLIVKTTLQNGTTTTDKIVY